MIHYDDRQSRATSLNISECDSCILKRISGYWPIGETFANRVRIDDNGTRSVSLHKIKGAERLTLINTIGEGRMGVVYEAFD